MIPRLRQALERLEAGVEETRKALATAEEGRQSLLEQHERLTKQYWSQGKELMVLRQNDEQYAALSQENARLHERQEQMKQHARRLLEQSKALVGALKQA